jgi:hypothetical protein
MHISQPPTYVSNPPVIAVVLLSASHPRSGENVLVQSLLKHITSRKSGARSETSLLAGERVMDWLVEESVGV